MPPQVLPFTYNYRRTCLPSGLQGQPITVRLPSTYVRELTLLAASTPLTFHTSAAAAGDSVQMTLQPTTSVVQPIVVSSDGQQVQVPLGGLRAASARIDLPSTAADHMVSMYLAVQDNTPMAAYYTAEVTMASYIYRWVVLQTCWMYAPPHPTQLSDGWWTACCFGGPLTMNPCLASLQLLPAADCGQRAGQQRHCGPAGL